VYYITCLLRNDGIEIPIIVPEILHDMELLDIPNALKEEGNIKRNRLINIIAHDNFERIN